MITGCVNCMKWFWIRLLQYYFPPFKVVHFSQKKMTSTIAYFLLALAPFSMALFVHLNLPSLCRTTDLQQWYDVWFCTGNVAGRLSEWHSAQTTQSIHVSKKGKIIKWWYSLGDFHTLHICALALTSQSWREFGVAHPWPYLLRQCFKFYQTVAQDEFRILIPWDPFQFTHKF